MSTASVQVREAAEPAPKFMPPALPAGHVPRPRLDEALNRRGGHRLTLVAGQAGSGKTVLLSDWARRTRERVGWLTLDSADDTTPRFWEAVEAAIDHTAEAGGRPRQPAGTPSGGVDRVLHRLAALDGPLALILDDFHELRAPGAAAELSLLLQRASTRFRLVIACRADPPLRLQRLRLAGELAEIRGDDLAFTQRECASLMAGCGIRLDHRTVTQLVARTGGWAAALRLAALSLHGHDDPSAFVEAFAGDDGAVSDYLFSEVLERQPEDIAEFLLRTSVPASISPELADELTERADGGQILARLQAANFLLSAEREGRHVYHYHELLREFLYAHLTWSQRSQLGRLHAICSDFHRRMGDPLSAFVHAVRAEDWDLAEATYAESWPALLFGTDLGPLPAAAAEGRPALGLYAAHVSALAGDIAAADRMLAAAERDLARGTDAPDLAPLVDVLRLQAAGLRGDLEAVERRATGLLDQDGRMAADPEAAQVGHLVALVHLSAVDIRRDDLDAAAWHARRATRLAMPPGHDRVRVQADGTLALVEAARGRLRPAAELALAALELARERGWDRQRETADAYLALAWARYQWDELDEAAEQAASVRDGGDGRSQATAAALARLIEAARPDRDGAQAESPSVAGDGDPIGAHALLAPFCDASGPPDTRDGLGGPPQGTPQRLTCLLREAVALDEAHDHAGARAAMEQALALGEPDGYRRPFVDAPAAVRRLLVQEVRRGTSHRAYVADLLAALDRRAPPVEVDGPEPPEQLSERELAILRYLPTLMTNAEIASELFLSVNTVKTHLRSIYRKLGTDRRRDAVERARRLRLL